MAKMLKTKFPCRSCGVPAEVRRLRDGDTALCQPCGVRVRALQRIDLCDWATDRSVARAQEAEDVLPLLIEWLKSSELATSASRVAMEAIRSALPTEVPRLVRVARGRSRWAHDVLRQLEEFFDAALTEAKSQRPLQVLDGDGEIPTDPAPARPELKLVRANRSES